jgi:hypothetical protein
MLPFAPPSLALFTHPLVYPITANHPPQSTPPQVLRARQSTVMEDPFIRRHVEDLLRNIRTQARFELLSLLLIWVGIVHSPPCSGTSAHRRAALGRFSGGFIVLKGRRGLRVRVSVFETLALTSPKLHPPPPKTPLPAGAAAAHQTLHPGKPRAAPRRRRAPPPRPARAGPVTCALRRPGSCAGPSPVLPPHPSSAKTTPTT